MVVFERLRWKNFLSTGNRFTEIELDKSPTTLILGRNGAGKCFCINTIVRLRNKKTGEVIEMTIGDFYEVQKKQNQNGEDSGMSG